MSDVRYETNIDAYRDKMLSSIDIDKETSCWNWKLSKIKGGYGQTRFMGKKIGAHRLSYMLFRNPHTVTSIQEGLCVCHHCDNPSCVNPSHLFIGTQGDNNMDKIKKGRANYPSGSDHHWSKLSDEDVEKIKALCRTGCLTYTTIGEMYGVSSNHVSMLYHERVRAS